MVNIVRCCAKDGEIVYVSTSEKPETIAGILGYTVEEYRELLKIKVVDRTPLRIHRGSEKAA